MKLKEFLETLPDDADIAVGASSGYFFLGTKEHFLEKEGLLSTRLLEDLVNSKHRAQLDVDYICQVGVTPRKEARRDHGKDLPAETIEEYILRINNTAKRLAYAYKRIERRNDDIAAFQPIIAREVLRTEEKQIYGGLQIIIAGNEAGKFWMKNEYEEWEASGKLPNGLKEDNKDDTVAETDS